MNELPLRAYFRESFDELVTDSKLADPEMAFKVNNFYKVVDITISQLRPEFRWTEVCYRGVWFIDAQESGKGILLELDMSVKHCVDNYPSDISGYAQSDLLVQTWSFVGSFREELTEKSSIAGILQMLQNERFIDFLRRAHKRVYSFHDSSSQCRNSRKVIL